MEIYPSDLSDAEWALLAPLIPPGKPGERLREVEMRAVLNAIFYVLRTGCAWRMLPREYPPRSTVYGYFALFRDTGVWEQIMAALRERCRVQAGREATPSAGYLVMIRLMLRRLAKRADVIREKGRVRQAA